MNISKKLLKIESLISHSKIIRNYFPKGIISFTFDDFHASAYKASMEIFSDFNIRGTYYTSFGLHDSTDGDFKYYSLNDLDNLLSFGNEIGCHTYSHISAYSVEDRTFLYDVQKNLETIKSMFPDCEIKSFAYPFGNVTPRIKKKISTMFSSCRGVDHHNPLISSNLFIDLFYIIPCSINAMNDNTLLSKIDVAVKNNKWLIFYIHDISNNPSPFGCTKSLFYKVVKHAYNSGACILPVKNVLEDLLLRNSHV